MRVAAIGILFIALLVAAQPATISVTAAYATPNPAVANAGSQIVFTSRRNGINEIYLLTLGSGRPVKLANGSAPRWSPDAKRIVYLGGDAGKEQVYLMNADGTAPTALTNVKTKAASPSWSPDGKQIVFVDFDGGRDQIYTMNADGTGLTMMPMDFGSSPSWSPDGKRLAYIMGGEIYLVGPDGLNPLRLMTNHSNINSAETDDVTWSPDGSTFAYSFFSDEHDALYTVSAVGTNIVRLTPSDDINNRQPSWSPDGKYIVYSGYTTSTEELFIVDTDGTGAPFRITSGYVASQPSWSPAAR